MSLTEQAMNTPSIYSAIQRLRLLLSREEKWKWLGIIGFALCSSTLEVITASLIIVFGQVITQPETGLKYLSLIGYDSSLSNGRIIFIFAMVFGLIYLVKNIIGAIEVFFQNFTIQNINYHFKNKLLNRYANIDYNQYLTRNSSLGLQVVSGDAELMFNAGLVSLASIFSEGIVFLGLIAMVVHLNPFLSLVIFGVGALIGVFITKFLLPQFYRWGQKSQQAGLYGAQNLLQFFHAFKEIILLGRVAHFIEAYQVHSLKRSRVQAIQTATNALPRMIIEMLFVGLFVITIAVLCLEQDTPIQMVGVLGGYLYVGFRLMPGLNRIIIQLNLFKSVIPSIDRVYSEFTDISSTSTWSNVESFSFKESIALTNVNFSYVNAKSKALRDVTLEIKKGECVGIVGETGSGKSTLVDVILGLLKPQDGTVLVDHQFPVNSLQWHDHIGYVPQSIFLADDTIESNIAFGEYPQDINKDKLERAIQDAQLAKFIKNLPDGLKTVVGERGVRLSGGERQRIAIARALYRTPEVLIFDEATSALDNTTESLLMETIHEVSKSRTVIMIAHRLSTLQNCDRIVVMEAGKISKTVSYKALSQHEKLLPQQLQESIG